jgi:hypothetical protein
MCLPPSPCLVRRTKAMGRAVVEAWCRAAGPARRPVGAAPQGAVARAGQHVDYSSIIFIGTVFRNMKTSVFLLVLRIQSEISLGLTQVKKPVAALSIVVIPPALLRITEPYLLESFA